MSSPATRAATFVANLGCGFHDSYRLMKVVLNVQTVFARRPITRRLLGAGFRNGEELKLHTHVYSHEQMKTADEVMCQR